MARGLPPNKRYVIHFSRSRSKFAIFSRLIQWIERRPYSHVCIELADPVTQLPLIFQASKGMVNFFYKPEFDAHNLIVESYEVQTTANDYFTVWAYAVQKMGSDYSWLDLVSIGTKKLFKVRSWFEDGDRTNICSELVARICSLSRIPMPERLDDVTPSDFNKLLQTLLHKGIVRRLEVPNA